MFRIRSSFPGRILLLVLLAVAVAAPGYPVIHLGCPYGCRHYGYDIAHCVEYLGGGPLANMNTCEETQYCYHDATGATYCDAATCIGDNCYFI